MARVRVHQVFPLLDVEITFSSPYFRDIPFPYTSLLAPEAGEERSQLTLRRTTIALGVDGP